MGRAPGAVFASILGQQSGGREVCVLEESSGRSRRGRAPEEAWVFPQKARLMTGVRPCGAVVGPGLGPCWCEMGGRGGGGEGEGQAGVPALVLGGCVGLRAGQSPTPALVGALSALGQTQASVLELSLTGGHSSPACVLCPLHPSGGTRGHTRQVCWKHPSALPMGTRALPGSGSDFSLNLKTVLVSSYGWGVLQERLSIPFKVVWGQ